MNTNPYQLHGAAWSPCGGLHCWSLSCSRCPRRQRNRPTLAPPNHSAWDGADGPALWRSDGTAQGTTRLATFCADDPRNSYCGGGEMLAVNTTLFFIARDGANVALWKSDGTQAGTAPVKTLGGTVCFRRGDPSGYACPAPQHLTSINGTLFFEHVSDTEGSGLPAVTTYTLWRSDGTTAGTVPVTTTVTANPGAIFSADDHTAQLTNVNGTLFFAASDSPLQAAVNQELWASDGTAAGTRRVADLNETPCASVQSRVRCGSYPSDLTAVGDTLFFSANDGTHGRALWKSDGTTAGTVLVAGVGTLTQAVNLNGALLFYTTRGGRTALWRSDGTATGTTPVASLTPGCAADATCSTVISDTLLFAADDGSGVGLWRADGTTTGTRRVQRFTSGSTLLLPTTIEIVNDTVVVAVGDRNKDLSL